MMIFRIAIRFRSYDPAADLMATFSERYGKACRRTIASLLVQGMLCGWLAMNLVGMAAGQESTSPQWIWSPKFKKGDVPQGDCYFRKSIYLQVEHRGELRVAADDVYEAYVNGKRVGTGSSTKTMTTHNISKELREGQNIIAIKVTNRNGGTAGLAAEVVVECDEIPQRRFVTNSTWRTSTSVWPLWYSSSYRDSRWEPAQVFGVFGREDAITGSSRLRSAAAARRAKAAEVDDEHEHPEFRLAAGFQIQHVIGGKDTGSLIALAFNEFGELLVSREGGPLLVVVDTNDNQVPDTVRVACDRVKSCQGILALNGLVYVIGDGSAGVALYRLDDADHDGTYEQSTPLVRFEGPLGEHGPHGIVHGPDGYLYIAIGNHTRFVQPVAEASPFRHFYEGELVPRYEDPLGHAAGVKAPGGGVIRVSPDGQRVERIAGGVRNAYDLAFNRNGDLFMHDSDNEADAGLPWARPTRLLHIIPGGEYGWRSGWSNWPDYWLDSLPAMLDTGRGSPTGCVFYEHTVFPEKYQKSLFTCDWAEGRINSIRLQPQGSSYVAESRPFLEGRPLNVTDIDVSPDGYLYFSTGGRGTQGNIYRVVPDATPETDAKAEPENVRSIVRQPQPASAWGRQAIATKRQKLGSEWDFEIRAFVRDRSQDAWERAQALELMHLVGPPPADSDLVQLSKDNEWVVRCRAATLMGLIPTESIQLELKRLVQDAHPAVRRRACESLARIHTGMTLDELKQSLTINDRFENLAARRVLEVSDFASWETSLMTTDQPNLFAQGAAARLIARPDKDWAIRLTNRAVAISQPQRFDSEFLHQLRVMELAIERGQLAPGDLPIVGTWLATRFPSDSPRINRELSRLLVALQCPDALERMLTYVESDAAHVDRLHVGFQLRYLQTGWTPSQKARLLAFYEEVGDNEGGRNLGLYIDHVTTDYLLTFTDVERRAVLEQGDRMPHLALATLFQLPESEDRENIDRLIALDRRLRSQGKDVVHDLQVGILAILARSGDERGMAYLREVYDRYPERRPSAAMGLAQSPDGRNWDYLVRSIAILEDEPAKEVLTRLRDVPYAPEEVEHYRQVILCGLRLRENGGMLAAQLLEHWVGKKPEQAGDSWDTTLPAWQAWFEGAHPQQPAPTLPEEKGQNRWTTEDLETFLASQEGMQGSAEKGRAAFEKAQCVKCHVHGRTGENFGPDLTSIAKRFRKSEILESILFPSQVVSDQYVAYQLSLKSGRTVTGQVVPKANQEFLIVQSDGTTVSVVEPDIEEIVRSKVSPMPEGLLNDLSLAEIADLFAFLMSDPGATVAERP